MNIEKQIDTRQMSFVLKIALIKECLLFNMEFYSFFFILKTGLLAQRK